MVIKDIDRDQIDFIAKTLQATPVAHIDHFTAEKLGSANLVEEVNAGGERKIVKITGCPNKSKTVSILLRGSN
jgi:T-complex protein 1 subunit delta